MKEEITKIERTDKDVDNSVYEIKTPHTDEYGNIYYTKEVKSSMYTDEIDREIEILQERLIFLNERKIVLNSLESKVNIKQ